MRRSTLLDGIRIDEEARRCLLERRPYKRSEDLRIAAAFDRIEESRHYLAEGCASIGEFGETVGFSASETRMLFRTGRAVRLRPSLRTLLLKGRLTLEGAAVLERVLSDPLVGSAYRISEWVYFAKTETARSLRDRVKRRLEEIRSGGSVHELTVHLSDRGLRDFDRARDLLSDRAKRDVSDSEAVERLSDYYLEREDPDRVAPGQRLVGDTALNRSRHVPAAVKRALRERANSRCEVPFCDKSRELEFAHIVPHRDGGAREAASMVEACHGHHVAFDSGWLTIEMRQGRPVFRRAGCEWPRAGPKPPHLRPDPLAATVAGWPVTRPPPAA
jgi:hypothetical protein